jgi:flagellar basal body-associated protein FliL
MVRRRKRKKLTRRAVKVLVVAVLVILVIIAGMLIFLFLRPLEEAPQPPVIQNITPNVTPTPEGVIEIGRGRR